MHAVDGSNTSCSLSHSTTKISLIISDRDTKICLERTAPEIKARGMRVRGILKIQNPKI